MQQFLGIVRSFLDVSSDLAFGLVNRNRSETLPPIDNVILLESASSLASKIRHKKLKSQQVVESYIARIKEINPIINAVVDTNFTEALKLAKRADELVASGADPEELEKNTPFLGVPFTNKDAIAVKGLRHTIGLVSRRDERAEEDADAVVLMRRAGGIPLCVTNVSEACMWWESSNYIYGITKNPYDTTRIVGGSSGGEGALIAAAGSVFGIGSDVGGSIRIPSFMSGIFGHKPSPGIVSNLGQLPKAQGDILVFLGTGPMCRHATDLLPMLKVLAGDNVSKLKLDTPVDVSHLKYYYMEDDGGSPFVSKVDPEIRGLFGKISMYMENNHGMKLEKHVFPTLKNSLQMWSEMMAGAEAPTFCEELADRKGKINAPIELLKKLVFCSNHTLPAIGLGLMEKFAGKTNSSHQMYVNMCSDLREEFVQLLGDAGVFLYPTHPRPAAYHHQPFVMPFNFAYTAIVNVLGFPATHCPMGLSKDGLPIGIQIIANKNNDHLCLAVARQLETEFGGWRSPNTIL